MKKYYLLVYLFTGIVLVFGALFLQETHASEPFGGGTGTEGDPYLIETAVHLNNIRDGYLDKHFLQTADLDLSTFNSDDGWEPIRGVEDIFCGSYDGGGYNITGLYIRRETEDGVGLFGSNTGLIENVNLVDCDVEGNNGVGGLTGGNNGQLHNCQVSGTVKGNDRVGGLVGSNYLSEGVAVSGCFSSAAVSGNEEVGGLVGFNDSHSRDPGFIEACYATGSVTGVSMVGGLVGHNYGYINYCYATGQVNGSNWTGGLVGRSIGSTRSCFWDVESSGRQGSSGGKGLNTNLMKTISVFQNAAWSTADWVMNEGEYPRLTWEGTGWSPIPAAEPLPLAGDGSAESPYQISTAQQLEMLSWYAEALGAHFILVADLDCAAVELKPIGDLGLFSGLFDGQGHIMSNVTINQPESDMVGLFSVLEIGSGEIRNLKMTQVSVSGRNRVGVVAGEMRGDYDWDPDSYTVTHLYSLVDSCEVAGTVSGDAFVGGLVGIFDRGKIESSTADVEVTGNSYIGGLVGYNSFGQIFDSSAAGAVTGKERVGGLLGYFLGFDLFMGIPGEEYRMGIVSNCFASGPVDGETYVGGLVGYNSGQSQGVIDCYSVNSVSGDEYVGGLVGLNRDGATIIGSFSDNQEVSGLEFVGGLVGSNDNSLISNSFNAGRVSGGITSVYEHIGGLAGESINNAVIEKSYNLGTITGYSRLGGLVGTTKDSTVSKSFNAGQVYGNFMVGGLIGEMQSNTSVTDCYSTGRVNGANDFVGGLAGALSLSNISNAYASGLTTGRANVGGLVGNDFLPIYSSITNSYYDRQATGRDTSAGGEGRDTEQMTYPYDAGTFVGWNFGPAPTWTADEAYSWNDGYPYLTGVTPEPATINLYAEPVVGGTVDGGGIFPRGKVVTVSAEPAEQYNFVNWKEDGEEVSTDPDFELVVTRDRSLTAHFALDQHSVTVAAEPGGYGIVSGGGTFNHGTMVTVEAEANPGFRFLHWVEDNEVVSTEEQYTFELTGPRDLTAIFDLEISFGGGTGVEGDPYLIGTPAHLYNVRHFLDAHFEQIADIDLDNPPWNTGEGWQPIGWAEDLWDYEAEDTFRGHYDGKGYTISNLMINREFSDVQGLFGLVSGGEIRNVVLEDVNILGNNQVGSLIGMQSGGTITGCHTSGLLEGYQMIGGLVGSLDGGTIESSSSSAGVTAYGINGGLVGFTGGTIRSSFATGTVEGGWYTGGFAGRTSFGLIENCYAKGPVTSPDGWGPIGGFAGGERWGEGDDIIIRYCYAVGAVNANDEVGGFIGVWGDDFGDEPEVPGIVENCYWDIDTSGQVESQGGSGVVGKTTAEMKAGIPSDEIYNGWLTDKWIFPVEQYPLLAWQEVITIPDPAWTNIIPFDAQTLAYDGGALAASFISVGTGLYMGSWDLLTSFEAQALATDGNILVVSVDGLGVWFYSGGIWDQLTTIAADYLAVDNGKIAASFSGFGIYHYDGEWQQLTTVSARALAYDDGKLAASVDGFGTWYHDGTGWEQLTPETAQHLDISGSSIAASFADFGIWFYDGYAWDNITPATARALALDNGILSVSVDGFGTWLNDGEWQQLTTLTAQLLDLDDISLAASFDGHGVWLYE